MRRNTPGHPLSAAAVRAGFTLIELLIAMVILSLLAALSYPGYQRYVAKARRAEAQAALHALMQQQERHFTRHNTYLAFSAASIDPAARHFRWWSGSRPASSGYELQGAACTGQPIERCVALRALPGTERVDASFRDPDCGVLALDSSGRRSASGPAQGCWP